MTKNDLMKIDEYGQFYSFKFKVTGFYNEFLKEIETIEDDPTIKQQLIEISKNYISAHKYIARYNLTGLLLIIFNI